jgi:siroheme decarboxylase
MDAIDRKILLETEKGLQLTPEPFKEIAVQVGITPKEVIERLKRLQETGIIRRFGASLKPNSVGFLANALVAWKVPQSRVEEVGRFFSEYDEISHCYEREPIAGKWEYNIYTVMHAHERETIQQLVKQLSTATALEEYSILYSKRNLKTLQTKEIQKC